jgi:hypothetical protein
MVVHSPANWKTIAANACSWSGRTKNAGEKPDETGFRVNTSVSMPRQSF